MHYKKSKLNSIKLFQNEKLCGIQFFYLIIFGKAVFFSIPIFFSTRNVLFEEKKYALYNDSITSSNFLYNYK